MHGAPRDIHDYLRRASAARRRRALSRAAARAVGALSCLLVAVLLLLPLAPGAREWVVRGLVLVAGSVAGLLVLTALRRLGPDATARWLAGRDPTFGGALADALEFSRSLDAGRAPSTGSDALAAAHVRSTADRVFGRDPGRPAREEIAVRWRPAAVAAALALATVALMPRSWSLLVLGLETGARDVARYEAVELSYTYPAYLRLPPRTEMSTGDVQAPAGTHVTVAVEADRELDWARLELAGGPAQDMAVDGFEASGRLVVVRSGHYTIRLKGRTGDADPAPPLHAIEALPDRSPSVRLRSPADDVVLDSGEDLELLYRVADDYGVEEVVLVAVPDDREAAGSGAGPEPPAEGTHLVLETFAPPALSRVGARGISPLQLGIEPGRGAHVSLHARDADAVGGPKWARSRSVHVQLRSRDEVREMVDDRQGELAERLLAALAGHLVDPPAAIEGLDALRSAHRHFNETVAGLLRLFPGVLENLHDGAEADLSAARALEDMQARLQFLLRVRRQRADFAARSGPEGRLRDILSGLHPDEVAELEADVLFFDMWADRRAALRAADSADDLAVALERLLATLEAEQLDAEEAAEALADVAAELSAMRSLAEELSRSVPEEFGDPAEQAERFGEADQLLAELQAALERGDTEQARQLARELAQRGSELVGSVGDLAAHGAVADPELMREVAEAEAELERLRARQADLRDRTNALREEAREAMAEGDRERMEELFEELVALTDEALAAHEAGERGMAESPVVQGFFDRLEQRALLREELIDLVESVRREGRLPSRAERTQQEVLRSRLHELELAELVATPDVESLMAHAERAREELGRLRQTLADRDPAEAWRPARHALYRLDELSGSLERADEADLPDRARPFRRAQVLTAEVLTKLEELESHARRSAQRALTGAQRQELRDLGAEQSGLSERARELARRLNEAGVDAPFLGDEVGEAVERAARHMGEAERQLEGSEPSRASETQGEAMSRLEEAAGLLEPPEPRGRPRDGGSRRGRSGRGGHAREDVEIPDVEDYRVPKEFREEILAAMRETAAPRGYEEHVREYYRRLVE